MQQIQGLPDSLNVMHTTFMAGNMSYNAASGMINPPNINLQNSLSPTYMFSQLSIDDYMVVTSDVGIIKFANNSFALYRLMGDTPTVTYQPLQNFPGYLCYQFDYATRVLYIGNGTDILNYTVRIDRYPITGSIAAIYFQNNTSIFPQKVNHTYFRVAMDRYLFVACSTCRNFSGTIRVFDYRSTNMMQANFTAITMNNATVVAGTNGTNTTNSSVVGTPFQQYQWAINSLS
jgi:hypothetical protein